MVSRSEAKQNSAHRCALSYILPPEILGKSEVNNKTLNPTPHVDLTSAYIPSKTQVGDVIVEQFMFYYARNMSLLKIGIPVAHFATPC